MGAVMLSLILWLGGLGSATFHSIRGRVLCSQWKDLVQDKGYLSANATNDRTVKPPLPSLDCGIVLQWQPDAASVPDKSMRAAIRKTRLPWRILHVASEIEFILVPPGDFVRGARPGDVDADPWTRPQIMRTINKPFYIGRYEVTNKQFRRLFPAHKTMAYGEFETNADELPVTGVSWVEARRYCESTGLRLPTDDEWERACRAGTTSRGFWGESPDALPDYGRVCSLEVARRLYPEQFVPATQGGAETRFVKESGDAVGGPSSGGAYRPNPLGIYDMIGNVWEMCEDSVVPPGWTETSRSTPEGGVPLNIVLRGGSWMSEARYDTSYARIWVGASVPAPANGFRCAFTPRITNMHIVIDRNN